MLRFRYRMRARPLSKAMGRRPDGHGTGPEGRIMKMRKVVTALFRHERIEGKQFYLLEARGYAELLIQKAQKYGDQHPETMEMADYWLLEKDLIPKLFNVLAPRYNNFERAYTTVHNLPKEYPGLAFPMAILELKGNPWPPVLPRQRDISGSLVNVLLEEARKDYNQKKKQQAASVSSTHIDSSKSQEGEQSTDELTSKLQNLDIKQQNQPNPSEGTPV